MSRKLHLLVVVLMLTACVPVSTQISPTLTPVPSATLAPVLPTAAVTAIAPSATSIPAPTAPAATPATDNSACTNQAAFVADVAVPDNTVYSPGTAFVKIWRVRNDGTCTWDSSYLVAYLSGTTMTQQPGYWIVQPGQTVAPGQTVDISVGMTSPVDAGTYTSYWGLKKVDGTFMPIQGGANGNSFYVMITVNNGDAVGKITAASIDIEPEQGSGPVCTAQSTYLVHAHLTADGPATAAYEIDSSAGQIPAGFFTSADQSSPALSVKGSLAFDQAGTQAIHLRFTGPYPYPGDITVLLWVNQGQWYNARLACQ